ncbi:MAG: hypothetical protein JSW28_05830 [Thermoplasmata archaeon]|nr:MAG: hypothetical protein JSW28_05830 [Thermoplasmata archaeon]
MMLITGYVSIQVMGGVLIVNRMQSFPRSVGIINLFFLLIVNIISKVKSPMVEQVFLIHEDGRLISYASLKRDEHQDKDVVGAMLTAVKDLLSIVIEKKEAKGDGGPYKFILGEKNVILRMGQSFFIALVIKGEENKALLDKADAVIREIQEKYGGIFYKWPGEMTDFEGAHEIIIRLLPLEELSEAEKETIKDKGWLKKVLDLWSMMYEG